jgi:mRNA-degrading endonuclease toxin of MazEF toxin-antitoxin module
MTVAKDRLESYRGTLTPAQMQQVNAALRAHLGL